MELKQLKFKSIVKNFDENSLKKEVRIAIPVRIEKSDYIRRYILKLMYYYYTKLLVEKYFPDQLNYSVSYFYNGLLLPLTRDDYYQSGSNYFMLNRFIGSKNNFGENILSLEDLISNYTPFYDSNNETLFASIDKIDCIVLKMPDIPKGLILLSHTYPKPQFKNAKLNKFLMEHQYFNNIRIQKYAQTFCRNGKIQGTKIY